jgi:hypothetical protein
MVCPVGSWLERADLFTLSTVGQEARALHMKTNMDFSAKLERFLLYIYHAQRLVNNKL